MASYPITYFMANRRGKVEVVTDFFLLGSRVTVDGDCSRVIRRRLLLARKALTDLDKELKSRDITLLTEVCIFNTAVFHWSHAVVNGTVKKVWGTKESMPLNCGAGGDC